MLACSCRLKAAQGSKTITSLLALNCQRRIMLTGTPVQNNLDEFFGKLPGATCPYAGHPAMGHLELSIALCVSQTDNMFRRNFSSCRQKTACFGAACYVVSGVSCCDAFAAESEQ